MGLREYSHFSAPFLNYFWFGSNKVPTAKYPIHLGSKDSTSQTELLCSVFIFLSKFYLARYLKHPIFFNPESKEQPTQIIYWIDNRLICPKGSIFFFPSVFLARKILLFVVSIEPFCCLGCSVNEVYFFFFFFLFC